MQAVVTAPSLTLAAWASQWLAAVSHRVRPQTFKNYRAGLTLHWVPRLGAMPLDEIRRTHVRGALRDMLGTQMKPGTVRQQLRMLSTCLEDAVDDEIIPSNPCRNAGRGVLPKRPMAVRALSPDALRQLLTAARCEPGVFDLLLLLALLGIRVGELLALRWDDLDILGGTVTIARTRTQTGTGPTKSGRVSVLEMPDLAVEVLTSRRARRPDTTYVFESRRVRGAPYNYIAAWNAMRRVRARAGLPSSITLHALRHTYGSGLLGVADITTVQMQLTHASVETTRTYTTGVRRESCRPALNAYAEPLREFVAQAGPALRMPSVYDREGAPGVPQGRRR